MLLPEPISVTRQRQAESAWSRVCAQRGPNLVLLTRTLTSGRLFSSINYHPDAQVPLYLARTLSSNHVWRAPGEPWSRFRSKLFLALALALLQHYPHSSGPGACPLSSASGASCRRPLCGVATSANCSPGSSHSPFPWSLCPR